jgi:DNA-binding Lrp family transcriptional regulator
MSWVYVLLKTEPSQMENVLEKIREIDGVEEAYMVYGLYDILIKVKGKIPKELKTIVQRIRSQDNVRTPLTLMVIKE